VVQEFAQMQLGIADRRLRKDRKSSGRPWKTNEDPSPTSPRSRRVKSTH
jgi:hypothetical protein